MLLIGSRALVANGIDIGRKPVDFDYIATYDEYKQFVKDNEPPVAYPSDGSHMVCKFKDGRIFEFEIAWEDSSAADILALEGDREYASLAILRLLKESHKYKRNSPHFMKTMRDVKLLRGLVNIPKEYKELLKKREKETYNYSHPKLSQSKKDFFTDAVQYVYDHDTIHLAIAIQDRPAYTHFMKDGAEVESDMKKWDTLPFEIKLNAALEESGVLALERSVVPFNTDPKKAFGMALAKLSTSISSGKFRKFCYDNFETILANYRPEYYDKFLAGLEAGVVKPHIT